MIYITFDWHRWIISFVVKVITLNPNTVNASLDFDTRALYYQVLFERQNVLATSMADLAEPARVEPCVIRTIGSPY